MAAVGIRCSDRTTPLIRQKFALTSPTSGGRLIDIVRSRTKTTEFFLRTGVLCNKVRIYSLNRCSVMAGKKELMGRERRYNDQKCFL
jgi:hypothetical protein